MNALSEARRRAPRPGSPVGGRGSAARMGGAGAIRGLTAVNGWRRADGYISACGFGQARTRADHSQARHRRLDARRFTGGMLSCERL